MLGNSVGEQQFRAGEAGSFLTDGHRVMRYLNVAAHLLQGLLIMMMFHSLAVFMALPRQPLVWAAAAGLALLTALVTAFWSPIKVVLIVLFFLSPMWVSVTLRYWPETADLALDFLGRWVHFLTESYQGTLVGVPPDAGYFTLALILLLLGTLGWIGVRRNAGGLAIAPGLGVLMFQWFFFFDTAQRYLPLYLLTAGLMVSILQYRRWLASENLAILRRFSLSSVLFSVTILLLVIMTVSAIMPAEAPTWSLTRARQWFTATFPVFDRVRGDSGTGTRATSWYSLNLSGYGPSTALGGPLQLDPSPAFSLTLRARMGSIDDLNFPLYLKGRTLGHYTGQGWLPEQDEHWEWFEPGARFPRWVPSNLRSQQVVQEITPVNLETNTLFGAGDIREIRLPETALAPTRSGGEVMAKSNYGDVIGHNILRRDDTYSTLSQVPYWEIDPADLAEDEIDHETLGPYLVLPDEVPPRVHELAREITADAEGHYEKAQAITEHLRKLPYSLDVGPVTAGREFTDHFLFEQRRGYCTYHSTALAVMLRAVGVPTRWVQGFLVSAGQVERAEDDPEALTGIIPLSVAHAWVEVWLTGYGWVPFEATPAFPSIDHTLALPRDPITSDPSSTADDMDHDPTWLPGDLEDDMGFFDDHFGPAQPGLRTWQQSLTRAVAAIAALLLALTATLFFLVRRRDTQFASGALQSILPSAASENDAARQVALSAVRSIFYLSHGFALPTEGLTPREFASRVADRSDELGPVFNQLIDTYEQLAYGGRDVSDANGVESQQILHQIMRALRKELGLRQYVTKIYLTQLGGMRELIASAF